MDMIEFSNVAMTYENGIQALLPVSMQFASGQSYSIFGASGCGKTTLLNLVAGILTPTAGTISFSKSPVISMVFSRDMLLENCSALENICYGIPYQRKLKEQIQKKAVEAARLCRIEEYLHQNVSTLSAGQRQRVALARAMIKEPDILLMDEPFSHLDRNLKFSLLAQIKELQKQLHFTLLFVSHDYTEAINAANTILYMDKGKILQTGTLQELLQSPSCIEVAKGFHYPGINLFPSQTGFWGFYPQNVKSEAYQDCICLENIQIQGWQYFQQTRLYDCIWKDTPFQILMDTPPESCIWIQKQDILHFDSQGNLLSNP